MHYKVSEKRYDNRMNYSFCGKSGLQLPKISLGLWHNFGEDDDFSNATEMIRFAFDNGITHFDLANGYGPGPGAAETTFGKILQKDFKSYRDEMIIATKAGYKMWEGPYQDGGSRKYLMSSIDQSLKRLGVDYVDIFYSHRFDPFTPIEETMRALSDIVKQGKALYVGISNYPIEETRKALWLLSENKTPCLIYQGKYNMFMKDAELGLFEALDESGVGYIAFSPLAQGLLSDKYLNGIPEHSRAANPNGFLQKWEVTEEVIDKATRLNNIAKQRGQTLSEMAISWVLSNKNVTSALVGVSSVSQLQSNVKAIENTNFSDEERWLINEIIY
jgi:L-glyceraldehyde 3-phosphate reductase